MGRWFLVRHGETSWNREGRIQGHSDVALSEPGRCQMRRMAARLAGYEFSTIYSSDLARARDSALAIVDGRGVSVEIDSDLREFSYGKWEGLAIGEVESRSGRDLSERINSGDTIFAAPGGEDTAAVVKRVRRFYARAVKRHNPDEELLIVAHGGPLRALAVCLLDFADDYFWRFGLDCASLSIISHQPGGSVLELWNDTNHLASVRDGGPR